MKTWAGMGLLVCAVATVNACAAIKSEPQIAPRSATEDEILARTRQFSQAIVADDTVVFPPRGDPMRGRAALASYWSRSPERRMLSHSATADRVDVSGDLATEWGALAITTKQGSAAPVQSKATYISIWTRQNGVWRKQMDTWW